MSVENDARNFFLGKNGYKRFNCAQTIALLFKDRFDFITDDLIRQFKKMGHGRAPHGECGMLYAAKYIFEQDGLHSEIPEVEDYFREIAGTTSCREVKKKKVPFCAVCLEKTALYIEEAYSSSEEEIA